MLYFNHELFEAARIVISRSMFFLCVEKGWSIGEERRMGTVKDVKKSKFDKGGESRFLLLLIGLRGCGRCLNQKLADSA